MLPDYALAEKSYRICREYAHMKKGRQHWAREARNIYKSSRTVRKLMILTSLSKDRILLICIPRSTLAQGSEECCEPEVISTNNLKSSNSLKSPRPFFNRMGTLPLNILSKC
jgi:hypothetical protein